MSKSRILVVEDESLVALEIKETLETAGYEVPEIVSSGDKVLDAAIRQKPDLIIMDIHLKSFTDGIDAAARLAMLRDVPVIYITAYSNGEIRERALRTNPTAYLLKPLDSEELRAQVGKALGKAS